METTTEEDIIINSKTDHLYSHDFGNGKYFQVVYQDENGFEIKIAPRTMFKVVYIKSKEDINSFEIIKLTKKSENGTFEEKQRVNLSGFEMAQLSAFSKFISSIDLKSISERKIKLSSSDELENIDEKTKKQIITFLQTDDGVKVLEEISKSNLITSKDIIGFGYIKSQLDVFKKLLSDLTFKAQYKIDNNITKLGDESIWQFFFQENSWIFGYGLSYIWMTPADEEGKIEQTISGNSFFESGKKVDGLLAANSLIKQFAIVEIKTPSTNILEAYPSRPAVWRATQEFSGGISQVHKYRHVLKNKVSEYIDLKDEQGDPTGETIFIVEPKSFLIIGSITEFMLNDKINYDKLCSFETIRNELRHPEIMTFDELYKRAECIVVNISK
jgi:hypothetical protein